MNLSISGHHLTVTPALHDYVIAKLERIQHHFEHVIDVNVILSVEKLQAISEITLHVRGKDIFARCCDSDMYAAIDGLTDKLDRQIIKYKQKRSAHEHQTLRHAAAT